MPWRASGLTGMLFLRKIFFPRIPFFLYRLSPLPSILSNVEGFFGAIIRRALGQRKEILGGSWV